MGRAVAAVNYGYDHQLSPNVLMNNNVVCEPAAPAHSMSPERVAAQMNLVNGVEIEHSPSTSSEGDSLRGCKLNLSI